MKRNYKTPLIAVLGIVVALSIISFSNSDSGYYFEGNVRKFSLLSLVQENRNMDCDAFNQISVTYDDNVYQTLANGRQGLTPFIDSSVPLDLTHSGKDVSKVHFELALDCDGNAMDGTTVVSGTVQTRICGDPDYAGTTCIVGDERITERFDSLSISKTALNQETLKVIHTKTFTEAQLNSFFNTGSGKIFFKHESFPILKFDFIHPSAGSFSATYDSKQQNSKIIAQFGLIDNKFVAGPTTTTTGSTTVNPNDTDSDGVENTVDVCPNDGETYNGYEDTDGCPDVLPTGKGLRINWWTPQILDISSNESTVTVSLGIESLSNTEIAPTLKVANLDGFIKEEFQLPNSCLTFGVGWKNCETTIQLDIDRYPEGSYKLILSSEVRTGISVDVPLEVVDQTPDTIQANTNLPNDPSLGKDPSQEDTINKIVNFVSGKQSSTTTGSGVKITRSTQTFDFGTDDITIIMILVGITASVGIFAKYRKKLK